MSQSRQLGIRLSQPALVLIYPQDGKMRRRIMPIRHFQESSNIAFVAAELRARHECQLENVPSKAVEKMLRILQEHLKGATLEEALSTVEKGLKKTEDDTNDERIETSWIPDQDDQDDEDDFWLLHTSNTVSFFRNQECHSREQQGENEPK